LSAGYSIGGSVIVETVFSWPGMGREMVLAIQYLDYPMAMGAFFLMGLVVIAANFIVDMLYGYLDPRVTYG
jgi:peptide/nickel transport system permease protein